MEGAENGLSGSCGGRPMGNGWWWAEWRARAASFCVDTNMRMLRCQCFVEPLRSRVLNRIH